MRVTVTLSRSISLQVVCSISDLWTVSNIKVITWHTWIRLVTKTTCVKCDSFIVIFSEDITLLQIWPLTMVNLKRVCSKYCQYFRRYGQEKKEEIWLSPMTKAPTPTEMSKGQSDNTNNATKSSITHRYFKPLPYSPQEREGEWVLSNLFDISKLKTHEGTRLSYLSNTFIETMWRPRGRKFAKRVFVFIACDLSVLTLTLKFYILTSTLAITFKLEGIRFRILYVSLCKDFTHVIIFFTLWLWQLSLIYLSKSLFFGHNF